MSNTVLWAKLTEFSFVFFYFIQKINAKMFQSRKFKNHNYSKLCELVTVTRLFHARSVLVNPPYCTHFTLWKCCNLFDLYFTCSILIYDKLAIDISGTCIFDIYNCGLTKL